MQQTYASLSQFQAAWTILPKTCAFCSSSLLLWQGGCEPCGCPLPWFSAAWCWLVPGCKHPAALPWGGASSQPTVGSCQHVQPIQPHHLKCQSDCGLQQVSGGCLTCSSMQVHASYEIGWRSSRWRSFLELGQGNPEPVSLCYKPAWVHPDIFGQQAASMLLVFSTVSFGQGHAA